MSDHHVNQVIKPLISSPDDLVIAFVVHVPEKMDPKMLYMQRMRIQEWLDENKIKIPLMLTCGDIKVDILKVKKGDLADESDLLTAKDATSTQVTLKDVSLDELENFLQKVD